jgi:hypothetical protein
MPSDAIQKRLDLNHENPLQVKTLDISSFPSSTSSRYPTERWNEITKFKHVLSDAEEERIITRETFSFASW